LNVLPD